MNNINELCNAWIQIHNIKWYEVVKYINLINKISTIEQQIYHEDIFSFLNNVMSFLISIKNFNIKRNDLNIKKSNMQLIINNNIIDYRPTLHTINIIDNNDNISYAIYKDTKIPKMFESKWNILNKSIRLFCINIIKNIAKQLSTSYKDGDK